MSAILYLIFFFLSIKLMLSGSLGFGFFLMMISSLAFVCWISKTQAANEIENQKRIQSMNEENRQKYYDDNTIDYTVIVGEDSRKSVTSSVVRGAIGGAVLGPVGLAAGALSGKNTNKTMFTIIYKSGRREVITVDNDSEDFRKYARYIR